MAKGQQTKNTILDAAFDVASAEGLEALSIGVLADQVGLSKSGLFAHFRSKEALQIQVLEFARDDFIRVVVEPALLAARGEPRIRALFENWMVWGHHSKRPGGCVFLQAAAEYDDRPGAVRECLVAMQRDWTGALARAAGLAIAEGHFRPDVASRQFSFDLYAVMMSCHFHSRLLGEDDAEERARVAFERLLSYAR